MRHVSGGNCRRPYWVGDKLSETCCVFARLDVGGRRPGIFSGLEAGVLQNTLCSFASRSALFPYLFVSKYELVPPRRGDVPSGGCSRELLCRPFLISVYLLDGLGRASSDIAT